MEVKGVVFDLDGTLADTASLTAGKRMPYHVLRLCPPGGDTSQIAFPDGRQGLPSHLITRCYRTAILTSSPIRYASTVCDLLGIDYERLLTAGPAHKAGKLLGLCREWEIPPRSLVYVGDLDSDREAAAEAGCPFVPVNEIHSVWNFLSRCEPAAAVPMTPSTASETQPAAATRSGTPPNVRCPRCRLPNDLGAAWRLRGRKCWNCKRPLPNPRPPRRQRRPRDARRPPRRLRLDHALSSGRSLNSDQVGEVVAVAEQNRRTALAMLALHRSPGQHGPEGRRRLQEVAFDGLGKQWRDCILDHQLTEGCFRFPPWLVTLAEIRSESALRRRVIKAAGLLFPVSSTRRLPADESVQIPVSSLWPYHASPYGDLVLRIVKDWRGQRMGSGPNVMPSAGYFPAIAIAGHIRTLGLAGCPIVPIPTRPMTRDQPGQYSLRLAHRVAELLEVAVADVIAREDSAPSMSCVTNGRQSEVVIVDDQLTTGGTMSDVIGLLHRHHYRVAAAFTWTYSTSGTIRPRTPCMFSQHLGGLADLRPCTCPTDSP